MSSCTCSTAGMCTHCKTTYGSASTPAICSSCQSAPAIIGGLCMPCDIGAYSAPPYPVHDDGWTIDDNGEVHAPEQWGPIWVDEPPEKPKCLRCRVELSKTMDAYWGKVPGMADVCVKCRGKK